jgi:hypothetical protein
MCSRLHQNSVRKEKIKFTCIKNNAELFSRLYISCQTKEGNLDEFFNHENQACPPALSDGGNLRLGTKSDLLTCFEEIRRTNHHQYNP